MNFTETTALNKLLTLKKKIRDVRGSTGAGKTIGITMWDIDYAQSNENSIIDVVSESYPHLEQGAIRDFQNIMKERGYWDPKNWNDTHHLYSFPNGSQIQFQSYDKLGKAHGPRRDVLHLNEGNYLPWAVVDQLITRTRDVVWCEYNPSSEFWMHTEILGKRDDVDSLKLTYLDNEGLSESERLEIESHRNNKNWWRVYGEGELGQLEGKIYQNWIFIDDIPHEARLERYGLDFGYSNDPTAIVAIYYYNGGYILDEIVYQKGLSNKQIADILNNKEKALVVADSAEPKSIDEISGYGITIIAAEKGKDSVAHSIQIVQEQKMSVTSRSINIIREYRNYLWQVDKNGKVLNVPEDAFKHSMDATAYGMVSIAPIKQKMEYNKIMKKKEERELVKQFDFNKNKKTNSLGSPYLNK